MPARKITKTASRGAKKATAKSASKKSTVVEDIRFGRMKPYGPPIRDAIVRGDIQEMRKLAVVTRSWVKEVQTALTTLEKNIQKLDRRK